MHHLTGIPDFIFTFIDKYNYPGIFFTLTVEEAGIALPIPGDLILAYIGFRISLHKMVFWQALFASTAGVTCGATILYLIFRFGGRPLAYKYGRYIFLPKERLDEIESWLNKRGAVAVIIGRFIPGLRVFVSAVSGLAKLPYRFFLPQVLVAAAAWSAFFLWTGIYLGRRFRAWFQYTVGYGYIFFIIFIVSIIIYMVRHRKAESKSKIA
jgi:membrane protein DedA with SNARE-associated domain